MWLDFWQKCMQNTYIYIYVYISKFNFTRKWWKFPKIRNLWEISWMGKQSKDRLEKVLSLVYIYIYTYKDNLYISPSSPHGTSQLYRGSCNTPAAAKQVESNDCALAVSGFPWDRSAVMTGISNIYLKSYREIVLRHGLPDQHGSYT